MTVKLLGLVFCAGVVSHIFLFRISEWDRHSPVLALTYALLNTLTFVILVWTSNCSFSQCLAETSLISCVLVAGIFASMLVYRLLLHPLREFPGPFGARVSSAWTFREQWPDLQLYIKLQHIHNRYGDFVRIKPRELSICSADAINDIHGPKNVMRKGEFYEQIHPAHSLQFNRNLNHHKYQRRFWDKAFQRRAVQQYTPRIVKHYKSFMSILTKDAGLGIPADISKVSMDLFFDVISDLTLGESYNALATDQRHPNVREFLRRQKSVGFVLLNMWVFHLIRTIPAVVRQLSYVMRWFASIVPGGGEVRKRLSRKHEWYKNALKNRKQMRDISPDLYTYLSQSETFEVDGIHEVQLAIIAGADTNAITVSNACYLLCKHPEYQQKLLTEISNLPISEDIIDDQHLIGKPCLSSIVNETLRLYPPVPGGLQRLTPTQGATIAGRYIPGNMVVSTPTYALQRDPRSFVRPDDFVPERWTSQPDLILRKEAFVPFSYGAYSCAGKPLAMMQLRMVIAMIIRKYELSFAPGQQRVYKRYIQDQADCFTLHLHPLPIVLEERISKH